jgi:hypothetical protein
VLQEQEEKAVTDGLVEATQPTSILLTKGESFIIKYAKSINNALSSEGYGEACHRQNSSYAESPPAVQLLP